MWEALFKPLGNYFGKDFENNEPNNNGNYPLKGSEGIFIHYGFLSSKTPEIPDAARFKKS